MSSKIFALSLVFTIITKVNSKCDGTEDRLVLDNCSALQGLKVISSDRSVTVDSSNCDVLLEKVRFVRQPKVSYPQAKEDRKYTVIVVDPDAPRHNPGEYFLHMIATNVPGNALKSSTGTSRGTEIIKYVKPSPPSGSGDHRYIFLVYEQDEDKFYPEAPAARAKFVLSEWLKGLPLCGPKDRTQFKATFDY